MGSNNQDSENYRRPRTKIVFNEDSPEEISRARAAYAAKLARENAATNNDTPISQLPDTSISQNIDPSTDEQWSSWFSEQRRLMEDQATTNASHDGSSNTDNNQEIPSFLKPSTPSDSDLDLTTKVFSSDTDTPVNHTPLIWETPSPSLQSIMDQPNDDELSGPAVDSPQAPWGPTRFGQFVRDNPDYGAVPQDTQPTLIKRAGAVLGGLRDRVSHYVQERQEAADIANAAKTDQDRQNEQAEKDRNNKRIAILAGATIGGTVLVAGGVFGLNELSKAIGKSLSQAAAAATPEPSRANIVAVVAAATATEAPTAEPRPTVTIDVSTAVPAAEPTAKPTAVPTTAEVAAVQATEVPAVAIDVGPISLDSSNWPTTTQGAADMFGGKPGYFEVITDTINPSNIRTRWHLIEQDNAISVTVPANTSFEGYFDTKPGRDPIAFVATNGVEVKAQGGTFWEYAAADLWCAMGNQKRYNFADTVKYIETIGFEAPQSCPEGDLDALAANNLNEGEVLTETLTAEWPKTNVEAAKLFGGLAKYWTTTPEGGWRLIEQHKPLTVTVPNNFALEGYRDLRENGNPLQLVATGAKVKVQGGTIWNDSACNVFDAMANQKKYTMEIAESWIARVGFFTKDCQVPQHR